MSINMHCASTCAKRFCNPTYVATCAGFVRTLLVFLHCNAAEGIKLHLTTRTFVTGEQIRSFWVVQPSEVLTAHLRGAVQVWRKLEQVGLKEPKPQTSFTRTKAKGRSRAVIEVILVSIRLQSAIVPSQCSSLLSGHLYPHVYIGGP
jgi:hypothetical protein